MRFLSLFFLLQISLSAQSTQNSIRREILLQSTGYIVVENGIEQPKKRFNLKNTAFLELLSAKPQTLPFVQESIKGQKLSRIGLYIAGAGAIIALTSLPLNPQNPNTRGVVGIAGLSLVGLSLVPIYFGEKKTYNAHHKAVFVYNLHP